MQLYASMNTSKSASRSSFVINCSTFGNIASTDGKIASTHASPSIMYVLNKATILNTRVSLSSWSAVSKISSNKVINESVTFSPGKNCSKTSTNAGKYRLSMCSEKNLISAVNSSIISSCGKLSN